MERYCTLQVANRRVGLPLALVRETLAPVPTSPLVLGPDWIIGLFSIRGQVIPVVDLAYFVGAEAPEDDSLIRDATHFVLVEHGDFRFAVPTSRVSTVEVDDSAFQTHPDSAMYPALHAEMLEQGTTVHIIQLDRLKATLSQALGFARLSAA